jgi:hypothetical protein
MPEPKLPRGVFGTVWSELTATGVNDDARTREVVRQALIAGLPGIQRHAIRKAARQILALDEADRRMHAPGMPNTGPWNDMRTTLRRLTRGEPLPSVPCFACEETGWVLCPEGYCPDCCDGNEHNHEPVDAEAEQ